MPSRAAHEAMASRCQGTIEFLLTKKEDHSEWIAVIAFYKALHLVEALFAAKGVSHSRNHESREEALKSDRKFENIYRHYRQLWTISTNARYLSSSESFSDYMSADEVEKTVVRHLLHQVERSVRKQLPAN